MDEIQQTRGGKVTVTSSPHIMYVLGCDHVMMSAPTLIQDGKVHCAECNVHQRVKGVHVFEWHVKCLVCNYGRWTGLSEMLAVRLAGAHERIKQHRTVTEYARNPSATQEAARLRKAAAI
jgi:hypothetical protein